MDGYLKGLEGFKYQDALVSVPMTPLSHSSSPSTTRDPPLSSWFKAQLLFSTMIGQFLSVKVKHMPRSAELA